MHWWNVVDEGRIYFIRRVTPGGTGTEEDRFCSSF